jgi:chemotaxis protein CheD
MTLACLDPFAVDEQEQALPRVYLLPGEMHCAETRTVVTTVLGSCVAVCLHHRSTGISGINHFVLPISEGSETGLRYGDYAIDCLVASLRRVCGDDARFEAKVFGGAEMFPARFQGVSVGARNAAIAERRLAQLSIPIVAQATGGRGGFFMRFDTGTGTVMARRITKVP